VAQPNPPGTPPESTRRAATVGQRARDARARALASLVSCLTEGSDLALLEGAAGVGKSAVLEDLAAALPSTFHPVLVSGASAPGPLPLRILGRLGVAVSDSPHAELKRYVESLRECGRSLVLLVDDAEQISTDALRWLRSLVDNRRAGVRVVLAAAEDSALLEALTAGRSCVQLVRLTGPPRLRGVRSRSATPAEIAAEPVPTVIAEEGPAEVESALPAALPATAESALPEALPGAVESALPGAVESALPEALPGAVASALPGALESALPGAVESALPEALPAAVESALPGALESALPGAVERALPAALAAAVERALPAALAAAVEAALPEALELALPGALADTVGAVPPEAPPVRARSKPPGRTPATVGREPARPEPEPRPQPTPVPRPAARGLGVQILGGIRSFLSAPGNTLLMAGGAAAAGLVPLALAVWLAFFLPGSGPRPPVSAPPAVRTAPGPPPRESLAAEASERAIEPTVPAAIDAPDEAEPEVVSDTPRAFELLLADDSPASREAALHYLRERGPHPEGYELLAELDARQAGDPAEGVEILTARSKLRAALCSVWADDPQGEAAGRLGCPGSPPARP
jgi:CheY-like chemotaxis protein